MLIIEKLIDLFSWVINIWQPDIKIEHPVSEEMQAYMNRKHMIREELLSQIQSIDKQYIIFDSRCPLIVQILYDRYVESHEDYGWEAYNSFADCKCNPYDLMCK